jgi:hypothetical protein
MPGPLELEELANKRREVRFVVFTIKPSLVPSSKRSFHGEVKEATARASLKTNTPDNLSVTGVWLIFQKEIVLKKREAWRDSQESFTEVDKDGNLKN